MIASVSLAAFVVVLALVLWVGLRKRIAKKKAGLAEQQNDGPNEDENARVGDDDDDVDLPLIDFFTISASTNEFSFANKIGEGGFGSVYKV